MNNGIVLCLYTWLRKEEVVCMIHRVFIYSDSGQFSSQIGDDISFGVYHIDSLDFNYIKSSGMVLS